MFVIHFIQPIIEELAILASLCSLAGWNEPYLVTNSEDRFSHIEANEHIHDKTSKMDCTPKVVSDQPKASTQSDQSASCLYKILSYELNVY